MPIYVYRNLVTEETFELEQRMTDEPLTVHPETGEPVKRLIQPVGIVFKGSGFYVNDSRSKGASTPSAGGAKAESGAGETGTVASTSEPVAAAKAGSDTKSSAKSSAKSPAGASAD